MEGNRVPSQCRWNVWERSRGKGPLLTSHSFPLPGPGPLLPSHTWNSLSVQLPLLMYASTLSSACLLHVLSATEEHPAGHPHVLSPPSRQSAGLPHCLYLMMFLPAWLRHPSSSQTLLSAHLPYCASAREIYACSPHLGSIPAKFSACLSNLMSPLTIRPL